MTAPDRPGDRNLELAIGRVLWFGIRVSSICLGIGLTMTLVGRGNRASRLMLAAGLLILLATPATRVVISVVDYARERDWVFVVLTVIVLLELLGSVLAAVYGVRL